MDQLSAHLDRGWDLAQRGDAAGASACARRALELDPQSPEVHNLLGYTAALLGETDEALDHYRQAIALDETYFEAMLNAAEVLIPLGDWDEAVSLCDDALDLAETDEEACDSLLLKVDALLAKGDDDAARVALKRIPSGPYVNPSHSFLVGRAHYELGDMKSALPFLEDAVKRDGENPDAHYYLGLLKDEEGEAHRATESFLRARQLDALRPPPPWSPKPDTFGTMVENAILKLDVLLARYVREAQIYCVDLPGAELVVDGVDPRVSLLIDAPEDKKAVRVFVYQRNVERTAGSLAEMEAEIGRALEREVSTVFGNVPNETDKRHLN